MRRLARIFTVSLAVPFLCAMAHASTLMYDFSATGTPYGNITLSLPASPTPTSFNTTWFKLAHVPILVDGDAVTKTINFYTLAADGGGGGAGVREDGPQLFTGPTSNPTFLTGTFPLDGFTLTITNPNPAAVPEPSSLFLLGTGLIGVCGLLRRRFVGRLTS